MNIRLNRIIYLLLFIGTTVSAQQLNTAMDSTVTVQGKVNIKGKEVKYKATTGKQPVWDDKGKIIAGLFFTYYQRTDVDNIAKRPLVISFNGGPGSASVWMHIAYTGPKILNIDEEGYPVQPYGIKDNPNSILDVADIVYVNPVNTGYSRAIDEMDDKTKSETFFGVKQDIKYLATWIDNFVTRNNRWSSPKFLIGESYGTPRVSGLSLELQNSHWMYLNGVILVSPTTLGIERGTVAGAANFLPYYTAAAWFHKQLPADLQSKDLVEILPEVEAYTIDVLTPAISKGGYLPASEKKRVAATISRYSGLSEKVILEHNLRIPKTFFWKELLRNEGYNIGRLDSRYLGIDEQTAGTRPDYAAELTSWLHSFTPAINHYFKNYLNYHTDVKYNMFGPVRPWDRSNNRTGYDLRQAMAQNPYLNVLVQSGYYDGGTDYFNAKYNMWQMDPSGRLKDRMEWKGYRSGHMMYLRNEDLQTANDDLREFIAKSLPAEGMPAKYSRK
ncbi:peptidase S10 serine carboxypeptidase [Allomuricauda ruestringensis DSM 13258]|uniref:Peptidase S10 serine carboxypeptidase n=1 Tax=Allomuricauda ruestringensis (strain DSM 13258 / CIP 107369 / LMG 19739 / B1) TaxID=886377 RepID=G2PIE1_ALLRU|nr:carboxypeptidase [Allomuricauda ruestringensis]AEM71759.1 peptidase S10 serine carboxypeptidase [Allomuricauda ruestringensis DSM 13258]